MLPATYVLFAAVALIAPAPAGADLHVFAQLDEESHSVDVRVADDGTLVLVVDEAPVGVPTLPEAPTPVMPTLP